MTKNDNSSNSDNETSEGVALAGKVTPLNVRFARLDMNGWAKR